MDPRDLVARAGLRPPSALTVAITGRCNLRCRHCWVEAGTRAAPGDVPVEAVVRLAGELTAAGGRTAWISGGEPLAHAGWREVLSRCCAMPALHSVGLQTNGTLLDADAVATLGALPRAKLLLQVSLDGSSPRTHDRVRGAGSFAATLDGLARLASAGLGPRTSLAFTEMRHNMRDIPELLRLAEDLGLRAVVGGTLVKDGRAARSRLEPPTVPQVLALVARFEEDAAFRARYLRVGTFPAVEWWRGRAGARGEPCPFLDHPYVSAAGTLYPCALCLARPFGVARVFERPFPAVVADAVANGRELAEIARSRATRLAECAGCPAALACAGGCMGRALATRGRLLAVEDRCDLRRAVHRRAPGSTPPPGSPEPA
jgi:radical SAM protein with 4Fe4S-binding SPASM domain